MSFRHFLRVGLAVCLCVAACSGCSTFKRGKKRGAAAGADTISPEELAGNYALGERTEEGTLITDVLLDNVLFAYDSFQITDSELSKIEQAAQYMRDNIDAQLVAEGHCDERGTREYNMSLGENRALSVRAYLIRLGIDGARVQTRSYGEESPLDPGHDESAWRFNRRVEFQLYR